MHTAYNQLLLTFNIRYGCFSLLLCQASVPTHLSVGLFGPKGVKERLFLRISDLLAVPIGVNDGHSEYSCEK